MSELGNRLVKREMGSFCCKLPPLSQAGFHGFKLLFSEFKSADLRLRKDGNDQAYQDESDHGFSGMLASIHTSAASHSPLTNCLPKSSSLRIKPVPSSSIPLCIKRSR